MDAFVHQTVKFLIIHLIPFLPLFQELVRVKIAGKVFSLCLNPVAGDVHNPGFLISDPASVDEKRLKDLQLVFERIGSVEG